MKINKLIAAYLTMEEMDAKSAETISYVARAIAIATFPHSKPHSNFFERKNGNFTLTMIGHPRYGLPYGSLARLLLAWVTRQAILSKSSIISLGKNFSDLLKTLNLTQSGGKRGDSQRLKDQMLRLFTTQICCVYSKENNSIKYNQFNITRSFRLWNPRLSKDEFSELSTLVLSQEFYEEITNKPVPIDTRMLNALRKSPLQIDIYVWLTYRFSTLKQPIIISWDLVRNQFGSNFALNAQGKRDFKKQFIQALHVVTVMYPSACVEILDDGLLLKPSPTHVSKRQNKDD